MRSMLLFIQGVGVQEILLIGVFILIFFGSKRIPDFMKGLGKGYKDFKEAMSDVKKEANTVKEDLTKIN